MMKFLTNMSKSEATLDPACPTLGYDAMEQGITIQELLKQRALWIADKVIGPPQGTEKYSSDQLKKQGLVGIYDPLASGDVAEEEIRLMKEEALRAPNDPYQENPFQKIGSKVLQWMKERGVKKPFPRNIIVEGEAESSD